MSEFSGKTEFVWGILRPDETAVMKNPMNRGGWMVDESLDIAGFTGSGATDDYGLTCALRGAEVLTDALTGLGVYSGAAQHKVVLFSIVTSVTYDEVAKVPA